MKPREILNMLSTNRKGAPHAVILTRMPTTGVVDSTTVTGVWSELMSRYGTPQLAFNQQLAKMKAFPPVKALNISDQLYEFADLCYRSCRLFPHPLVLFPAWEEGGIWAWEDKDYLDGVVQEVNARVLGKGLKLLLVSMWMVAGLWSTSCYFQVIQH